MPSAQERGHQQVGEVLAVLVVGPALIDDDCP
jgi:hypothetical protein